MISMLGINQAGPLKVAGSIIVVLVRGERERHQRCQIEDCFSVSSPPRIQQTVICGVSLGF